MDAEASSPEVERIAQRITELCEGALAERDRYLVSRLGLDLGDDLKKLKLMTGVRLSDFVQRSLARRSPGLELVRGGLHGNIEMIVRKGEAPAATAAARQTEPPKVRYHYRFWAAFAIPLVGGVRHLDLRTLTFKDVTPDRPTSAGEVLIEDEFIAPDGIPNRDIAVERNIERWLEAKGLEREKFLVQQTKELPTLIHHRTDGTSLLELLIGALESRDLQRVALPLDIVSKLMQKRP